MAPTGPSDCPKSKRPGTQLLLLLPPGFGKELQVWVGSTMGQPLTSGLLGAAPALQDRGGGVSLWRDFHWSIGKLSHTPTPPPRSGKELHRQGSCAGLQSGSSSRRRATFPCVVASSRRHLDCASQLGGLLGGEAGKETDVCPAADRRAFQV